MTKYDDQQQPLFREGGYQYIDKDGNLKIVTTKRLNRIGTNAANEKHEEAKQ